jgi:hypothetical protein
MEAVGEEVVCMGGNTESRESRERGISRGGSCRGGSGSRGGSSSSGSSIRVIVGAVGAVVVGEAVVGEAEGAGTVGEAVLIHATPYPLSMCPSITPHKPLLFSIPLCITRIIDHHHHTHNNTYTPARQHHASTTIINSAQCDSYTDVAPAGPTTPLFQAGQNFSMLDPCLLPYIAIYPLKVPLKPLNKNLKSP